MSHFLAFITEQGPPLILHKLCEFPALIILDYNFFNHFFSDINFHQNSSIGDSMFTSSAFISDKRNSQCTTYLAQALCPPEIQWQLWKFDPYRQCSQHISLQIEIWTPLLNQ